MKKKIVIFIARKLSLENPLDIAIYSGIGRMAKVKTRYQLNSMYIIVNNDRNDIDAMIKNKIFFLMVFFITSLLILKKYLYIVVIVKIAIQNIKIEIATTTICNTPIAVII